MQESRSFAYSLSQREDGWSWSVYDEDGVTVARGADPCRSAAQAAVKVVYAYYYLKKYILVKFRYHYGMKKPLKHAEEK